MGKHVSVLSYLAGKTFVPGIQCRQRLTTLLHQGQHTHTPQPVADGLVWADVTKPGQLIYLKRKNILLKLNSFYLCQKGYIK